MIAAVRNIPRQFDVVHQTAYTNLVVSGCSFTWNNHESVAASWPYYLRDLMGFEQVIDCSQTGGGNTHIFNSIVNELETNDSLHANNSLIVVMWSGLERTDILADYEVTADYEIIPRPTYFFDSEKKYSSASIHFGMQNRNLLSDFAQSYQKLFLGGARVTQSLIHIVALANYLEQKKFRYVFLSYENLQGLELADERLVNRVLPLLANIETLGSYADRTNQRVPNDHHPTIHARLSWTREVLIPYLVNL